MSDRDPEIIYSRLCRSMDWEGVRPHVNIYRLDDRLGWALKVVNDEGTSTVWDEMFDTEGATDAAFRDTLPTEGEAMASTMRIERVDLAQHLRCQPRWTSTNSLNS